MPIVNTALRYPGGKSKLSKFIFSLIESNDLHNSTYVEPYAGGAGIAINLLLSNSIKKVIINDLDVHIYRFWKSILNNTEQFLKLMRDKKITISEWKKTKKYFLKIKTIFKCRGWFLYFLSQ